MTEEFSLFGNGAMKKICAEMIETLTDMLSDKVGIDKEASEWIPIEEVQSMLKRDVSYDTLHRLAEAGEIRCSKLHRTCILYNRRSIFDYIEKLSYGS
jgi:hypothetical protein